MLANNWAFPGGGFLRSAIFALALMGLTGVPSSEAAQTKPLALEELAADAEWIALAKVERVRAFRDDSGAIRSEIQLEPIATLKGPDMERPRIRLEVGAGRLGGAETRSHLDRPFRIGGLEALFLKRAPNGAWRLSSAAFGRFRVLETADSEVSNYWIQRPRFWIRGFEEPAMRIGEFKQRIRSQ